MARVVVTFDDKRGGGVAMEVTPSFAKIRDHIKLGIDKSEALEMAAFFLHKIYTHEMEERQRKSGIIKAPGNWL